MKKFFQISVIVRTINERGPLERLLAVLGKQDFDDMEVIVVDNESDDGTDNVARDWGVTVVTIPRHNFTFPHSLNVGAEAAGGRILLYTVGHALPTSTDWVRRAWEVFNDESVAGAYSPVIPLEDCTLAERIFYWPGYWYSKLRSPYVVKLRGMGVLGATNCAIRRLLWQNHHFDENFELGGEDGEWAAWAMNHGYKIVCGHRLVVRHSHHLGFRRLRRQMAYWSRLGGPTKFSREEFDFRSDLRI